MNVQDSIKAGCILALMCSATAYAQTADLKHVDTTGEKVRVQDQKDSQSDMSQEQQTKMQMQMDRRSKAMATASNMMKKESDTSSSIVGNMK